MVLGLKPMGKPTTQKKKLRVLDRTKALYGPRTQAYGETNYLEEKTTSFGQNQGLVWSSDSNLWGNQLLRRKKTTSFGSRTQAYGETNYLEEKKNYKF